MKKSPWLRRGLVIAGLAGIALATWKLAFTPKKQTPRFETTAVEKGRLVARVTATGILNALVTVQVGTQVSGRIKELFVDFNSQVKKGQLLARIDPALFEATAEQAKANLTAANANAERARVQAKDALKQSERATALFDRKLIAEAERDTSLANAQAAAAAVAAAEAAVGQAHANLHQASVNLTYTSILSPVSGVVISRAIDTGQTVAASLASPTLFTIAEDLRKMQVEASVAESDVGRIQPEMSASFVVDAFPQRRFVGKVRQVRNAPISQQGVVTYTTVIDVANEDLALKPGMTANVTFIYAEREDALKVPNAAFRFRPANLVESRRPASRPSKDDNPAARTVYVERDGQALAVSVIAGISDGSMTEVTGTELKPGDQVILESKEEGGRGGGPPGGGPMGGGGRRLF